MTTTAGRNIEAIWEAFATKLRAFILKRVPHDAAADDILQDVFVKIHSRIHSLKDPTRLESWIYNIARNAVADHYRSRKPTEELNDSIAALQPPARSDDDLDLAPAIRRMIRSLPDDYRGALVMTAYEGLTQKEVAERLGLSLSGAKSRVQRAREMLKAMLLECCHLEFDRFGTVIECEPRRDCCGCHPTKAGCRTNTLNK
jgi:RNA polymerase sigma-70 factor (ECF subfamily)